MLPAAEENGMFIHRNERCTEKNVLLISCNLKYIKIIPQIRVLIDKL